jgi:hypothetical protein
LTQTHTASQGQLFLSLLFYTLPHKIVPSYFIT